VLSSFQRDKATAIAKKVGEAEKCRLFCRGTARRDSEDSDQSFEAQQIENRNNLDQSGAV
jgi:hypothetical protein